MFNNKFNCYNNFVNFVSENGKYKTMATKLSVNINKIATIRNARGGNTPNLVEAAINCERFGAHGITVHPRPDGRHIRYSDVYDLRKVVTTELNVEGYPSDDFLNLVINAKADQVTLVPDPPQAITSNAGWDTMIPENRSFLKSVVDRLHGHGIRVSIFVNAQVEMIEGAKATGCDRVELYTERYASDYAGEEGDGGDTVNGVGREAAIAPFVAAALAAERVGLGLNAGHDLSLENLAFFAGRIPNLLEVSIGHALISDALYLGLENTIRQYKRMLITSDYD